MTDGDGYNALIQAALERAHNSGAAMYVYATEAQWVVAPQPPPFGRTHIRCEPEPELVLGCARNLDHGYWCETVLWPRDLVAVKAHDDPVA